MRHYSTVRKKMSKEEEGLVGIPTVLGRRETMSQVDSVDQVWEDSAREGCIRTEKFGFPSRLEGL